MSTLTDWQQRQLDIDSGHELDKAARAKRDVPMQSKAGSAFQEGADTALLHQAPINPYRRAARALSDPESLAVLGKLAQEWEDGYVSNHK